MISFSKPGSKREMGKQNTTEREALDDVRMAINDVLGKRWMVAVWCVEAEDISKKHEVKMVRRVTWKFPTNDMEVAAKIMQKSCEEERDASSPPIPPPLEMADFLKSVGFEPSVVSPAEDEIEVETVEENGEPKSLSEKFAERDRGK